MFPSTRADLGNPRFPLLGALTICVGTASIAVATAIIVGGMHGPSGSEHSPWLRWGVGIVTGWIGLLQWIGGANLLLRGYAGAGTAYDCAIAMLGPRSSFSSFTSMFAKAGELDPDAAAWLRLSFGVVAGVALIAFGTSFPDRISLLWLAPIASSMWAPIVVLRIGSVHDQVERDASRRRSEATLEATLRRVGRG